MPLQIELNENLTGKEIKLASSTRPGSTPDSPVRITVSDKYDISNPNDLHELRRSIWLFYMEFAFANILVHVFNNNRGMEDNYAHRMVEVASAGLTSADFLGFSQDSRAIRRVDRSREAESVRAMEMVAKARRLWEERLTCEIPGNETILVGSADGETYAFMELETHEQQRINHALAELFGSFRGLVGDRDHPLALIRGDVLTGFNQQGIPATRQVTLAEVLIRNAYHNPNILIGKAVKWDSDRKQSIPGLAERSYTRHNEPVQNVLKNYTFIGLSDNLLNNPRSFHQTHTTPPRQSDLDPMCIPGVQITPEGVETRPQPLAYIPDTIFWQFIHELLHSYTIYLNEYNQGEGSRYEYWDQCPGPEKQTTALLKHTIK